MGRHMQSVTLGDDLLCLSKEQLSEHRYCTFVADLEMFNQKNYENINSV
jgi:hypothetical protein